jgi:type VI secretion system protein ImpA
MASRAEAYRQLAQAAARLRELEPHSPIPYLVQRAVELGGLPFPLLIKALIRDGNVISELNRELGIKESHPEES